MRLMIVEKKGSPAEADTMDTNDVIEILIFICFVFLKNIRDEEHQNKERSR